MSGIRIARNGKVHAEGPGEGDSATECGKGADYIHATDADVDCLACLKVIAKREHMERIAQETMESLAEFRAEHAGHGQIPCHDACYHVTEHERRGMAQELVQEIPALVTGHAAESHSRRGSQCRICKLPVVDHADVNVNDGVAVSHWTGTAWGSTVNPERVAAVADRRVNAREAAIEADNARLHAADADGFLADAYAKLPISKTPWQCMVHGDKFATMRELDAHIDAHLEYRASVCDECGHDGGHFTNCPVMVQADMDAQDAGTGCDCNPGAHGSTSHSPDCPKLVASIEAYVDRRRALAADLASLPPVAEQVASIRGNAWTSDTARSLDAWRDRTSPAEEDTLFGHGSVWSALRGKRKASKVTRRAWQSKLARKGR